MPQGFLNFGLRPLRACIESAGYFTSSCYVRVRVFLPSFPTLFFRSIRNQRGNCDPTLVTVRLYRALQLADFVFSPFTLAFIRPGDTEIQDIMPSVATLFFVRPGIIAAIAAQSLPPCISTEFFSLRFSPFVHVPVFPAVRAMLGSKE
jgi:hypothetical protein